MDIKMVEKLQQSPLPNRILNRLLVMLSLEKETLNDSLEPGASRSTGPGPGRPRSGHRPESISGENATTTGAVCGPQVPARSVVVGVTSARTILRWTTSVALGRRLVRRALCHYAAQFSLIAHLVTKLLSPLELPNRLRQAKDMD